MLKCHELFGFMSPALAQEILEYAYGSDKLLYRAILSAVAEARRLRPAFFEKKPRAERHADMLGMLSKPRLEEAGANLLRTWLLKSQTAMLGDFLDALGIQHDKGVVSDFPPTVEDAKLTAAVEGLLAKYPADKVTVYLNTITATSGVNWPNLETMLQNDSRLQPA
jgi:hypothetical protein